MPTALQTLLIELTGQPDLKPDEGTFGLQFEADGHTVVVQAHPVQPELLLVEVDVAWLGPEPDIRQLSLLLQINHAARFEHAWTLVLDEEQQVSLGTSAPISGLRAADLQALMLDGLERAQLVRGILQALDPEAADAQTAAGASPEDVGMVRV